MSLNNIYINLIVLRSSVVERLLRDVEVAGSKPDTGETFFQFLLFYLIKYIEILA